MKQLKSGIAPGRCGIYAEMLGARGIATLLWLLLCSNWNRGIIQTDWRRDVVDPNWKGKGDTQVCNNNRGLPTSLCQARSWHVIARILERVRRTLLPHQRHEQSGFTPKKSTVNRILALRVLTERLRVFRVGLLAAYVDFRKAFDSFNRDVLWRILALRGIPPNSST